MEAEKRTGMVTLSEELDLEESRIFKCENCESSFEANRDLKDHHRSYHEKESLKSKLAVIENSVSELEFQLKSDLLKLKEQEIVKKQSCTCKKFCHINHMNKNWIKSSAEEIANNMKTLKLNIVKTEPKTDGFCAKIYICGTCDKKLQNLSIF